MLGESDPAIVQAIAAYGRAGDMDQILELGHVAAEASACRCPQAS